MHPTSMLAAIALGSNLVSVWGTPAETLCEALHRLGSLGSVTAVSTFHETEPVGLREQPRFTNAAALLETDLGPLELMRGLLAIEHGMGRTRTAGTPPKGPRVIDLDLLLYQAQQNPRGEPGSSLVLNDPELVLPHPAMHERAFVLEPLAEIAPDLRHPVPGATVAELWAAFKART